MQTTSETNGRPSISRSRLLRRADWRFLTSTPQPQKSICFDDGLLAQSLAEISKANIRGPSATDHECDLAVAVNPTGATLRAAAGALRMGGTLYTEWTTWRAGGARGIRRRLVAAGFSDVQFYWGYPSPVAPRYWLPLQSGIAPCRYLAEHRFAHDNFVHRAARILATLTLRAGLQAGWLPHLSAVAYKGIHDAPDLFDLVSIEWVRGRGRSLPEDLSFLVMSGDAQTDSRIVGLVFDTSKPTPRWMVKLPRVCASESALPHEKELLERLHQSKSGSAAMVMPRPLFQCELDHVPVFGQTAVAGTRLNALARPETGRRLSRLIVDSQVALAKQSRTPVSAEKSRQAVARVTAELDRLAQFYMLGPELIATTRAILSSLDSMPLVCAHFDFAPWNVMQTEQGLGIRDWAIADWDSLPMLDLVYALANLRFCLDNGCDTATVKRIYREMLDATTPVGENFKQALTRYAKQVGLSEEQIPPLRLLTWIQRCTLESQALEREQDARAPYERREASVCVALWETELEWQSRRK